jgi:hypothetical protein
MTTTLMAHRQADRAGRKMLRQELVTALDRIARGIGHPVIVMVRNDLERLLEQMGADHDLAIAQLYFHPQEIFDPLDRWIVAPQISRCLEIDLPLRTRLLLWLGSTFWTHLDLLPALLRYQGQGSNQQHTAKASR